MGADNGSGSRTYCLRKLLRPDVSFRITGKNGQFHPLRFHFIQRAEHRIVLRTGCNDMTSFVQYSFYGSIKAFRPICCKSNPGRIFHMKQPCQLLSCFINKAGSVQRGFMCPPARISQGSHCLRNSPDHTVRFHHGRGGIIKINHLLLLPLEETVADKVQSRHSYTASSLIPDCPVSTASGSLHSRGAHQASPQPADMVEGTGIRRPGICRRIQSCSISIASAVV